ncbi:MAG: alpha-glucosidase domain-containing protein, partial [Marinilabilia sp.]
MKRIFPLIFLILALSITTKAQSYIKTDQGIKTTIDDVDLEIRFYSPSIVRVLKWPEESCFTKESLSVIKKPQKTSLDISQTGNNLALKTDELAVTLNMNNGVVSFETSSGQSLLSEKEAGTGFSKFNDAGNKTYSVSQSFGLEKNEAIYGLGFQQQGKMNQRNVRLSMIQNNTETYIPFFQSIKGYGLYWANYSPTTFTDNSEKTSFSSEVGDGVDYYFMYGGDADGVIAQMRELTGQTPMF